MSDRGPRPHAMPSGRSCMVPTFYVRPTPHVVAPAATGTEGQLDRDYDERADAAVLDAVRGWATIEEVSSRVPASIRWLVPDVLRRLTAAGKLERQRGRQRWRRTEVARG